MIVVGLIEIIGEKKNVNSFSNNFNVNDCIIYVVNVHLGFDYWTKRRKLFY